MPSKTLDKGTSTQKLRNMKKQERCDAIQVTSYVGKVGLLHEFRTTSPHWPHSTGLQHWARG